MTPHPTSLAEAAAWVGAGRGAFAVLLDEFLDAFYTEPDDTTRQRMIDDAPPPLNQQREDAYLGAVAEHLARRWGLVIPPWSLQSWRSVDEPWFVGRLGQRLSGLYLVESPLAFRHRRIFTEAEPLRRARMPSREVT